MNGYFFQIIYLQKLVSLNLTIKFPVLIYWASINTQIRMKAKIFKTSAEFSDDHFQSRTKEKNALAISSNQSQPIDSFDEVTKNFYETLASWILTHTRPDFWGGYSFIPYYFEFWQGHENRLNKRHVFNNKTMHGWSNFFSHKIVFFL